MTLVEGTPWGRSPVPGQGTERAHNNSTSSGYGCREGQEGETRPWWRPRAQRKAVHRTGHPRKVP